MESVASLPFELRVRPSKQDAYFTTSLSTSFTPAFPAAGSTYPPVSPLLLYVYRRYRNFRLLSITYASRPQLRPRLTLGGRTFPRKPWVFDGKDSHFTLATHSGILTTASSTCRSRHASLYYTTLPYQCHSTFRSFGGWFSPVHLRRRLTRLVSYYALFE